jgi:hypothetical protein
MRYPDAAWERAMKVRDVILRALSGELHWFRAAEIIGGSARTMRRMRYRYEVHGYDRAHRQTPSPPLAAPRARRRGRTGGSAVRERDGGFNVRHFHEIVRRDHGVRCRTAS